nr:hypothetical protein [uncultured Mucilaginibacter sp.]
MKTLALIFLAAIGFSAHAQKLPNTQSASLKVPADVKIDGRAMEWGDKFQAYNSATDVFYSIANTGTSLYFIVKTNSYAITNKVLRGGITITINPDQKKADNAAPAITFPMTEPKDLRGITLSMREVLENMDSSQGEKLLTNTNKLLSSDLRLIRSTGFKNVTDTLISVYNEHGIKAAGALSNKNSITCEFEIPIALLNLKGDKLNYNIRLNGPKLRPVVVPVSIPEVERIVTPVNVFKGEGVVSRENMTRQQSEMVASTLATDLSGEYTLAK